MPRPQPGLPPPNLEGKKSPGRRKGGTNARTRVAREVADAALESGRSPLAVMLDNMRWYHDHAADLEAKFERSFSGDFKDAKEVLRAAKMLKDLHESRLKAQSCAADAAPYVHPRLAAIKVDGTTSERKLIQHKHELLVRLEERGIPIRKIFDAVPDEDYSIVENKDSG